MFRFFSKTHSPHKNKICKHKILATGSLFLFIVKILFTATAFYVSNYTSYASGISSDALLECTNFYRKQALLKPLVLNPTLSKAGLLKIDDMDNFDYWAHDNPETGKKPWAFLEEVKYNYITAGENLAFDFNTADGVCKGWMESPTHRENLLHADYLEVGFAVRRVNLGEHGEGNLIVQFFGTQENFEALTEDEKRDAEKDVCRSEIKETLKITKPECGFINEPNLEIEAEIYDENLERVNFKINESDIDGRILEEGTNRIVKLSKTVDDGEYKIHTDEIKDNDKAIVNITVDTQSPKIYNDSIQVSTFNKERNHVFDIELKITDDNLEKSEIFYKDSIDEIVSKPFQHLGNNIYHSRISFPTNRDDLIFNATITALDKANNNTSITIDLYPLEEKFFQTMLSFDNLNNIWKYLLLGILCFIALIHLYDVVMLHKKRNEENIKENYQHHYVQFFIILLIIASITFIPFF